MPTVGRWVDGGDRWWTMTPEERALEIEPVPCDEAPFHVVERNPETEDTWCSLCGERIIAELSAGWPT